jgi:DNA (cytosine-5)-methyltransferase 1
MNLTTVDLFAGGGGLTLGFMSAGFNIVAAFDNWDPAIWLYKQNFGSHPIFKCDLSNSRIVAKIKSFNPEIIIGGPPCQDFSSAGKRDETLGRADLTISFANIIGKIRPRFFVMENVERAYKSDAFASAKRIFEKSGYGLSIRIIDASLCGVPQLRKRVFVIGEMNGRDGFLEPFLDSHLAEKPMTLRDYFGNRLGIEHYYRHPRTYARRGVFSIDEPSPTVRGVNRPIPLGYVGHPGDTSPINSRVRPLTTKERSMIQTFPESFVLIGSKTEVEQIIGNAVPVKLAEYVANRLLEYLLASGFIEEAGIKRGNVEFSAAFQKEIQYA